MPPAYLLYGEATGSPRGRHWGSIGREVFSCIEKYEELFPNFPYDTHLKKGKEKYFLVSGKALPNTVWSFMGELKGLSKFSARYLLIALLLLLLQQSYQIISQKVLSLF